MNSIISILLALILIVDSPSVFSVYASFSIRLLLFVLFFFFSIATIGSSIKIPRSSLYFLIISVVFFLCFSIYSNSFTILPSILVRIITSFMLCKLVKIEPFRTKYLVVVKIFFFLLLFSLLFSSISLLSGSYTLDNLFPPGQDYGYPVVSTMFGYFNRAGAPYRPTTFLFEPIHLGFTFSLYLVLFSMYKLPTTKNRLILIFLSFLGAFLSLSATTWLFLIYITSLPLVNYSLSLVHFKRIPPFILPLTIFFFLPFASLIVGMNSGQQRVEGILSTLTVFRERSMFDVFHPLSAINIPVSPDILSSLFLNTGLLFTTFVFFIALKNSIELKNFRNSLFYILPFFIALNPLLISFFLYIYIPLMIVDKPSFPSQA